MIEAPTRGNQMRILACSNCPAEEHLGSGYVLSGFVNGLRALGHEVDLLEPAQYEVLQAVTSRGKSYRQSLGMLLAVTGRVFRGEYDVVQFWGGEAWLATSWIRRRGLPRPLLVQHTNGPEPRYDALLEQAGLLRRRPLQRSIARHAVPRAFALADAVVTSSEYDAQWLKASGLVPPRRCVGLDVPLPECFIERPYRERDSRVIGYCGTWLPKKGIAVVAADMTRLLREFPGWTLLLLGTAPDDRPLESFPADIRSRIEVVPMIRDKAVLALQYERMEIFILPSVIESFGIALAEAMACGCAPVAACVGYASTLGRNEAVVLPEAISPFLYEAVRALVLDRDGRRRLADGARRRAQSLRWGPAIDTLLRCYTQWLGEHRRAMALAAC